MADTYDGLRDYLEKRYADSMVMTFAQIEALLGFPLPEAARLDPAWWTGAAADAGAHPQWRAWTGASRTATANLGAQTVRFDRAP
jgi:hypothetical protein